MAGKEGGDDLEAGLAVCTIVAAKDVSRAEILADSFRTVYPDRPFYVLVIDSDFPLVAEPIRQLALRDLPMKLERLHLMALIYNVTEFATALKPQLLLALLERHDMVVYLDPDTRLYAPMDELSYLRADADVL
ncbi:MAG: hypothetical protein HKL81_00450 [Acidimicrobiaceae bacterium]|nr:hypothetical protein [Acidimicrobiaceae bacterium]